ncbi:helicase associated domain-containing protein [Streptomyces sp. NPDC088246]|uniref:helicase associated domain-containing protein n=1 Tax=Streptomyces sp. NPDC088246 TaxID=3365842 RepID=UPI0037FAFF3A
MAVGRWLERQHEHVAWAGLLPKQRELLKQLGIEPLPAPAVAPAKARTGVWRLRAGRSSPPRQYKVRTGSVGPISRFNVEVLPDGTQVKLGVWVMNLKSRRSKLTPDKLQQLAELGLGWAA